VTAVNCHSFREAADSIMHFASPGDMVITMGAGESVKVADIIRPLLKARKGLTIYIYDVS